MTDTAKDPHPLLDRHHRFLLITTALVGAVSFFDFLATWHLLEVIGIALSPNHSGRVSEWQAVVIFMAGYLSRPLGAFLVGRYGDTYGRKPALFLNFLMLIVFTVMIALLPPNAWVGELAIYLFIIARLGQGMAFGSQFPILWTYVTEKLPLQNIGLGTGIVTGSAMLGGFLFFLLFGLIENTLTQDQVILYGWRLPFLMSGGLGLLLLLMVKQLTETPVFLYNQPTRQQTPPLPFFSKKRWQKALPIAILSWFIASIVMVMIFLLKTLLEFSFVHYDEFLVIGSQISLFFLTIGSVFFGFLTDRTNTAKVLVIGCALFIASIFGLFYDLSTGGRMLVLSFALTGFFAGIIGASPAIMIRICPAQHRLSNVSLIYNSVYAGVGIFLPIALGYTTFYAKYSSVIYLAFVCMAVMFVSFYLYYYPKNKDELYQF